MIYKIFDKKLKSGSVTRARSKTSPTHAKQKKKQCADKSAISN